jgi:hypothetical protein
MSKRPSRRRIVQEELAGVCLGDPRRESRAVAVADRLAAAPETSLPEAMGDRAMLEALYRHLSNDSIAFEALLEQHVTRTAARVAEATVFAVHDTTACVFPGEADRAGLGTVAEKSKGFFAHVTLAVSADGKRMPLGVLGCDLWTRKGERAATERESLRWGRGIEAASAQVGGPGKLIHVADREADIYALLDRMVKSGDRFIIRANQDRAVEVEGEALSYLFSAARETRQTYEVEVPLSRRRSGNDRPIGQRKVHPEREARVARLTFAARRLALRRPNNPLPGLPRRIEVNVVHVFELGPPAGQKPVEWLLLTSEPIGTGAEIARIIEGYRTRWTIEEYFKAIKTGCAFESRQLESFKALTNLLAYTMIIAYAMLLMRTLARTDTDVPAEALVSADQLTCLRVMTKKKLPARATARHVLHAIATLGVHLKSNGDPGWRVLSRGWKRLLDFEAAYQAMKGAGLVINR